MITALRWAAMWVILWAKSQDGVHKPQLLKRKESRNGETNRHRPLSSPTPVIYITANQTGSHCDASSLVVSFKLQTSHCDAFSLVVPFKLQTSSYCY